MAANKRAAGTKATGVHGLLEAMHGKEKAVAKALRPAASEAALGTLTALEVPPSMLALYAQHDGAEDAVFGPYRLLSVDEIVEERHTMNELCAANPSWSEKGLWDARWVPFFADGDGQYFCVDPAGVCEGGRPGQILFFDHEVGPQRELASFDVLVELLTKLAKKKLLGEAAWEESEEEIEELRAEARTVGLPKMSPKERTKVLAALEKQKLPREAKLDALVALVRQYGADEELWREVRTVAESLERWPLVVEAAETRMRLVGRGEKNWDVPNLVLGLHRLGRDEDAVAVLRAGLERVTNANERRTELIPYGVDRAFRARALDLVVEIHPKDVLGWSLRGSESTDPDTRRRCLEKVVALVDADASPSGVELETKREALRLLELERFSTLAPAARLAALAERAASTEEGTSPVAWTDVVRYATEIERWDVADSAGAKLLELTSEFSRYEVARFRIRALHALGRDDDALALVRDVIRSCPNKWNSACFVAIPDQEDRDAGRIGPDAAFAARCFAIVTEISPDNIDAWRWRRKLARGADRKATLEEIIAFCEKEVTENEGDPDYDEDHLAALRELESECEADLTRG